MRVSNKLTTSLKITMEVLDMMPNYNDSDYPLNNIDIFKKRKTYLEQQKENENQKLSSALEELNKFNLNILNNDRWGHNINDRPKQKEPTKFPSKPDQKDIEREVGINIMKKKRPRSRVWNSVSKF
jgi:hypothetical protein